jgi:hypothetical protein
VSSRGPHRNTGTAFRRSRGVASTPRDKVETRALPGDTVSR